MPTTIDNETVEKNLEKYRRLYMSRQKIVCSHLNPLEWRAVFEYGGDDSGGSGDGCVP